MTTESTWRDLAAEYLDLWQANQAAWTADPVLYRAMIAAMPTEWPLAPVPVSEPVPTPDAEA